MDSICYKRGVIRPVVAVVKSIASALEIAGGLASLHPLRRLEEVGIGAGAMDWISDFALAHNRSEVHGLAELAFGRRRLTRASLRERWFYWRRVTL